jgi:hypothetical protein
MHFEWHDALRVLIFFLSLWCCWMLILRYRQNRDDWTPKTLDYWYSLLMWCFVGVASSIQGIALDRPLTPAYVATCAAVLVTARGIHRKGSWGGNS